MSTQTNVELGYPLRLYSLGSEPCPEKSINYHSKTSFLSEVQQAVGDEVWDYIRVKPLGVIVQFVEKKFTWSSKLVEYLLVKQLVCNKNYEIWCLFGSRPARFSLLEFEKITSLNCAPFPKSEGLVETNAHKDLWEKMKLNTKKSPNTKHLKQVCTDVPSWSREDKIRFAYLSILTTIILGNDEKVKIPFSLACMVFDLPKFERYPWGRVAFKRLIKSVRDVDLEAVSYTIHGFIQTLQIWAYNVVPSLRSQIGHPSNSESLPLLKFSGVKWNINTNIDSILANDQSKIVHLLHDDKALTVWNVEDGEGKDKEIDTLTEAICKEGGLGMVTWVEKGSKGIEMNKEEEGDVNGGDKSGVGKSKEERGGADVEKTSIKSQKEIGTKGRKKRKLIHSKFSISSVETASATETLQMRIENVEKRASNVELVQAQMEDQLKRIENVEKRASSVELVQARMEDQLKRIEKLETRASSVEFVQVQKEDQLKRIEKLETQASSVEFVQAQMEDQLKRIEKLETRASSVELVQAQMEDQLKSFEMVRLKMEHLENEVKLLRADPKDYNPYQLKDEDMPLDELLANLNAIKNQPLESDDESTVDGRPLLNNSNELLQQSSPVKILKPTVALAEKFSQKKIEKTIKAMGTDNALNTVREKSTRTIKPAPSVRTPFQSTNPAVGIPKKVNQPIMLVGRRYDPFEPVDEQKVRVLDDWLQLDEEYPIGSQNNAADFFKILRTPQDWLNEEHINSAMNLLRLRFMKNEKVFRSGRIAFTDAYFTSIWPSSYDDFLRDQKLPIFPNGAFEYANGKLPAFAETGKKWRVDVDDIYGILHTKNNHWVALFISIPNTSIDVFDCGLTGSTNAEITKAVRPFAHMLPHLLRAAAPPSERPKMSVEKYKIRRPRRGIPQMLKVGDCGIYAIKFVECHALDVKFNTVLPDTSIKMVREKLAAEIFDETEQHGKTVSNPFPFGANDRELLHPY